MLGGFLTPHRNFYGKTAYATTSSNNGTWISLKFPLRTSLWEAVDTDADAGCTKRRYRRAASVELGALENGRCDTRDLDDFWLVNVYTVDWMS